MDHISHRVPFLLALASTVGLFAATPSPSQVRLGALAFETEAFDLETGAVIERRDLEPEPQAGDFYFAYHADRSTHAVVFPSRGAETAPVSGARWRSVSGSEVADLAFTPDPMNPSFKRNHVVVVRTATGSVYKVGILQEDRLDRVVLFRYERLQAAGGTPRRRPPPPLGRATGQAMSETAEQDLYGAPGALESSPGEPVHEIAKLLAGDGDTGDELGWSTAVSGDTVVVGAWGEEPGGAVYVFERPVGGWSGVLSEAAKLVATDGEGWEWFARSVAISGDTVVVGAHGDRDQGLSSGSAYVFEKPVGGWSGVLSEDAKLLPSDGASYDGFGISVAISGDTVVAGAPGDDDQGTNSGSAYLFEKPVGGWSGVLSEDAKLLASDGESGDRFGHSVDVSGGTVVVGAGADDDRGWDSGSAYIFEKGSGGWSGVLSEDAKLLASDGASYDGFGWSVAVSADTVVAGALEDDDRGAESGSAYLFERPVGDWSGTLSEDAKLLASDGESADLFGRSVAVSGDTVVAGAHWDDDQGVESGSAYLFREPVGGWSGTLSETAKLLPSDGAELDRFGVSVAVSGDTRVVGAWGDDDRGSTSGSAYVFGPVDSDGDGVPDELDICPDTVIPEGVPTSSLGRNRFALVDDDGLFDTNSPPGQGPQRSYSLEDTGGCSCEQIIEALDLGSGHVKFGCSIGALDTWVEMVNP